MKNINIETVTSKEGFAKKNNFTSKCDFVLYFPRWIRPLDFLEEVHWDSTHIYFLKIPKSQ